MKIKNLILSLIGAGILLSGCDNNKNNNEPKSEDPGTVDPGKKDEDGDKDDEFEHLTTDDIMNGSFGGTLVEIAAGRYLEKNKTYTCAFVTSSNLDKTLTYRSKYDDVATIESTGTEGSFYVKTHKQGDTIIYAYDVEGELVLRQLVQVRNSITMEKMPDYLFGIDKWKSSNMLGHYTLTFVSDDPLTGSLTGYDDFENTSIVFNLIEPVQETMYEFTFYKYGFELDMDQYQSTRSYVSCYVSVTGDQILIYYSSGSEPSLLEMFFPTTVENN